MKDTSNLQMFYYYLASLTVVCTDTLAQWPGVVRVGWPVPGAAQDALPRLQPRPEGAHVGLVLYCTVLYSTVQYST